MALERIRVLVVEDDARAGEDYRYALGLEAHDPQPTYLAPGAADRSLFALFHDGAGFPPVDLKLVRHGEDAVAAARRAMRNGGAFEVAFVDIDGAGPSGGSETAEALRMIDAQLMLVVTGPASAFDVVGLHHLSPPHRLFVLAKPFAPVVLRQMILSLTALRWELQHRRAAMSPLEAGGVAHMAKGQAICRMARAYSDLAETVMQKTGPAASRLQALHERLWMGADECEEAWDATDLGGVLAAIGAEADAPAQSGLALTIVHGAGLWRVRLREAQFRHTFQTVLKELRLAHPAGGRLSLETRNVRVGAHGDLPGLAEGPYVCLDLRFDATGLTVDWDGPRFILAQARLRILAQQVGATVTIDQADGGTALQLYIPVADVEGTRRQPESILGRGSGRIVPDLGGGR